MVPAEVKDMIELLVGLHKDALHIHVALLIYMISHGVLRRGWGSPVPWLIVLALALVNEAYDLWAQVRFDDEFRWPESVKDVCNSMIWPTVLLLSARFRSERDRLPERRDEDAGAPHPRGAGDT